MIDRPQAGSDEAAKAALAKKQEDELDAEFAALQLLLNNGKVAVATPRTPTTLQQPSAAPVTIDGTATPVSASPDQPAPAAAAPNAPRPEAPTQPKEASPAQQQERKLLHNNILMVERRKPGSPFSFLPEADTLFFAAKIVPLFKLPSADMTTALAEAWKQRFKDLAATDVNIAALDTLVVATAVDTFVAQFAKELTAKEGAVATAPAGTVVRAEATATPAESGKKENRALKTVKGFLRGLGSVFANSNGTGLLDRMGVSGWFKKDAKAVPAQPAAPEASAPAEKEPALTGIQEYRTRGLQALFDRSPLARLLGLTDAKNPESTAFWQEIRTTVIDADDAVDTALAQALAKVAKKALGIPEGTELPEEVMRPIGFIAIEYLMDFHRSTPAREMTRDQRKNRVTELDGKLAEAKALLADLELKASKIPANTTNDTLANEREVLLAKIEEAKKAVTEAEIHVETQGGLVEVTEIQENGPVSFVSYHTMYDQNKVGIIFDRETTDGSLHQMSYDFHLEPFLDAVADAEQIGAQWVIKYNHNYLQPTEDVEHADELEDITKFIFSQEQYEACKAFAEKQEVALSQPQWSFAQLSQHDTHEEIAGWSQKAREARASGKALSPDDQRKAQAAKGLQALLNEVQSSQDFGDEVTAEQATRLAELMAILEIGNDSYQTKELRSRLAIEKLFAGKTAEAVQNSKLPEGMKKKLLGFLNNDVTQFVGGMGLSEVASRVSDSVPAVRFLIGLSLAGLAHFTQTGEVYVRGTLANSRDWAQNKASDAKRGARLFSGLAWVADGLLKEVTKFTEQKEAYFSPYSRVLRNVSLGFGFMGMADGISGFLTDGQHISDHVGNAVNLADNFGDSVGHNVNQAFDGFSDAVFGADADSADATSGLGNPGTQGSQPPKIGGNSSSYGYENPIVPAPNLGYENPFIPAAVDNGQPDSLATNPQSDVTTGSPALPSTDAPEGSDGSFDQQAGNATEVITHSHDAISGQGLTEIAKDALNDQQLPAAIKTDQVAQSVAQAIEKINAGVIAEHAVVYRDGPNAGEPIPANFVQTGDPVSVTLNPDTDTLTVTTGKDILMETRGDGVPLEGSINIKIGADGAPTILEDSLLISESQEVAAGAVAPASEPAAPAPAEASPAQPAPVETAAQPSLVGNHEIVNQPLSSAAHELVADSSLPAEFKTPAVDAAVREAADQAYTAVIQEHHINYATQEAADAAGKMLGLPEGQLHAGDPIDSRLVRTGDVVRITDFDPATGNATIQYDAEVIEAARADGKDLSATVVVHIDQNGQSAQVVPDSLTVSGAEATTGESQQTEAAANTTNTEAAPTPEAVAPTAEQQFAQALPDSLNSVNSSHPKELETFLKNAGTEWKAPQGVSTDSLRLLTTDHVRMFDGVVADVIADVESHGLNVTTINDTDLEARGFSSARQVIVKLIQDRVDPAVATEVLSSMMDDTIAQENFDGGDIKGLINRANDLLVANHDE